MYKLDDTLAFQYLINELHNEAIGRYLNEPKNFKAIKDCLFEALAEMKKIKLAQGVLPGCPAGWDHGSGCKCHPVPTPPDQP